MADGAVEPTLKYISKCSSSAKVSFGQIKFILVLTSPVNCLFFPPHTEAEPGRAKRESRISYIRMLRTNQSKITRPLSISVHTCTRQRIAQYFFQLALWKKNSFVGIVVKNKLICVLSWSVLLSTMTPRQYSLPNIFSYCFCILRDFAKGFERKV